MFIAHLLIQALALLVAPATAQQLRLNITAVSAQKGLSTLECWEVDSPLYTSYGPDSNGAIVSNLGNVSALSWAAAQPGLDFGLHNAPSKQWVVVLSGVIHITLPHDNSSEAYITGGEFGLIFAADTADVSVDGHVSVAIGTTESVLLQIPTGDGKTPDFERLHMGPCSGEELTGWRMGVLP
ncbi:hypothetical protein VM1G_10202 [Cytospora mali]|uniref:Uncharacterized protein n=1 Tax=Cytospora mali TaxID=578113 RepID=A0A194VIB6_CYTMA|nr:hypothetical protein VM1G_10202 [Valsa mali]